MRDIMQMGFDQTLEISSSEQHTFDYSVVTEEQANQLQSIYKRVLIRHIATAYDDGKDLLDARNIKGLPHKEFIAWAHGVFGWSESTVINKINVALYWGPITPTVGVIDDRAMFLLSTKNVPESARQEVKERLASGNDIDEQTAKQIRDAHKAKEEAEQKARLAQQQLFTAQSNYQTLIEEYTRQINELKQEMADLVKPEVQIQQVEVIPQTVKDQLQRLQDKAKALTTQRDNLAAMNKKLSADLDVVEAKREQEARDARIRLDFQKLTKATYDTLIKFATQIPMHVDLPVLEPDDWARVEELSSTMSQISERLFGLHKSMTNQFVDASTGSVVEA